MKGLIVGIVILILVVILCETVLASYLPTASPDLTFLPTVIEIATGFGLAVYAIAGLFKGSS